MSQITKKIYFLFIIISLGLSYDTCPKYKCDDGLKKNTCGKLNKIKDKENNEIYYEFNLFPCSTHKQKCQISQLTDETDATCIDSLPIIMPERQLNNEKLNKK